MKLYTIGFTQKRAREFFSLLHLNGVQRLIDIRLNPHGQLSGFARQEDLPYFLQELAAGCQYLYLPILAPTKEILSDYRADGDWQRYLERFGALMKERNIPQGLDRSIFETADCCLLCSEPTSEHCHHRLVAELIARYWPDVEIIHL